MPSQFPIFLDSWCPLFSWCSCVLGDSRCGLCKAKVSVRDMYRFESRFYSPVAVEDPFVQNMKSIGQLAGERDLRKGQLYSSAAFELRSKRRWFRVRK